MVIVYSIFGLTDNIVNAQTFDMKRVKKNLQGSII